MISQISGVDLSQMEMIMRNVFPITAAAIVDEAVYGFFYPPHKPDWQAPAVEKASSIVKSHGAPASAA
jgi:hypothetical protein